VPENAAAGTKWMLYAPGVTAAAASCDAAVTCCRLLAMVAVPADAGVTATIAAPVNGPPDAPVVMSIVVDWLAPVLDFASSLSRVASVSH